MSKFLAISEAETFLQNLKPCKLNEISTKMWFNGLEIWEKLNMQAAKSASLAEDEFIKELVIKYQKTPIIIHNLIMIEIWKKYLFPIIIDQMDLDRTSFLILLVLHHQVTLTGVLEILTFHLDVCDDGQEFLVDLVDFCHRQLVHLIDCLTDPSGTSIANDDFKNQALKIDYQIGLKSISILCDIIGHLNDLPLGIRNRLLCSHDTPMVLVQLLELTPWIHDDQFPNFQTVQAGQGSVDYLENLKVNKLEGKIWIALFRMIHNLENARKYELNSYRKSRLLKLRSLLNPVLMDQMPYLEPFKRTLEELAIYQPPFAKKDLIIEQSPVIWDLICRDWEGKWKTLADQQLASMSDYSPEDLQEQAKLLSNLYSFEILEELMELKSDGPTSTSTVIQCTSCGYATSCKRCSRCKRQWYCSKQCQIKDWTKHQTKCRSIKY